MADERRIGFYAFELLGSEIFYDAAEPVCREDLKTLQTCEDLVEGMTVIVQGLLGELFRMQVKRGTGGLYLENNGFCGSVYFDCNADRTCWVCCGFMSKLALARVDFE